MSQGRRDHSVHLEIEASGQRHVVVPAADERLAPLSEVLRRVGLPLNTRCGGRGQCNGCLIELLSGALTRLGDKQSVSAAAGGEAPALRACEHAMGATSASIRIPLRSSLCHQPQIVSDYKIGISFAQDPLFQQIRLPRAAAAGGLARAIESLRPGPPVRVGSECRLEDEPAPPAAGCSGESRDVLGPSGDVYANVEHRGDHRVVNSLASGPSTAVLGAAIDVGTTTVALMLVDLKDSRVLARASMFNHQMHSGDDVVTRINLCMTDPAMLGHLQRAVAVQTILPLLDQALAESGQAASDVRCLVFSGNTTMLHLLAGVDPTPMGMSPFTPVFLDHRVLDARSIFGSSVLGPQTPCHLLPGAAAYIGSDLTAGIVASGLLYDQGPSLLVDVGTNGEIILKHDDKIIGCATAAGPAFEGARLSSGMRAVHGAISHVVIPPGRRDVQCQIIGAEASPPIGICGSGYVDFLATAHAAGILTATGRFDADAAGPLRDRIIRFDDNDTAFRVAVGSGKQPIAVSQRDVASLLQAKAAIAAGILMLLAPLKLRPRDIKNVYLAGGFGTHMDPAAAIACGLLPGFTPGQVSPVGNTSLAGAFLALMDCGLLAETADVAKRCRVVELNLEPEFEACYIDQLSLGDGSV